MINTFEALADFCEKHSLYSFDASSDGNPIVVSIPAEFEASKFDAQEDDRFLKIHLKACHTKKNVNKSFISDEVMLENKDSFHNCPVLAHIVKTVDKDGNESYDFEGHNSEIIEDPYADGEKRINYIERPVGVIPESSEITLEYDEKRDKNFIHVDGLIYCEHGNLTASILKERKEVACSVELAVEKMSYDTKDKALVIESFKFLGVTLLGKNVAEGMKGSRAYVNFDTNPENNNLSYEEKMLMLLEEIKSDLSKFNIDIIATKGGEYNMSKFEELLKKYNLTEEDITFEYENMTDEELEAAFEELANESTDDNDTEVETEGEKTEGAIEAEGIEEATDNAVAEADSFESSEVDEEVEAEDNNDGDGEDGSDEDSEDMSESMDYASNENTGENLTLTYEISHEDIKCSLYQLLMNELGDDYYWTYIIETYADYFIYCSMDKYYKRYYTVEGENVAFKDASVEVFAEFLTAEERANLDEMRSNYSKISEELSKYQSREVEAAKDEILSKEEYSDISKTADFVELVKSKADYSVEDIEKKADKMLLDYLKSKMKFTSNATSKKSVMVGSTTTDSSKNAFIQGLLEVNR